MVQSVKYHQALKIQANVYNFNVQVVPDSYPRIEIKCMANQLDSMIFHKFYEWEMVGWKSPYIHPSFQNRLFFRVLLVVLTPPKFKITLKNDDWKTSLSSYNCNGPFSGDIG